MMKRELRILGKIKTDEDAKVAIDTMLASLDNPYSRYMDKAEYNDQNTSLNSKITGIGVNIASVSGKVQIIFLTEQTLDFVLHRLFCGLAEMDTDDIGCLACAFQPDRKRDNGGQNQASAP